MNKLRPMDSKRRIRRINRWILACEAGDIPCIENLHGQGRDPEREERGNELFLAELRWVVGVAGDSLARRRKAKQ